MLETTPAVPAQPITGSTPKRTHIPALDGLRGIAILSVFIYHYGGGAQSSNPLLHAVGSAIKLGWIGVTLFFVLSGFLITGILWNSRLEPHWWRGFYARRALRIFPLYYLSLIVILAEAAVHHTVRHTLGGLWVFALFLQNVPPFTNAGLLFPFGVVAAIYWSIAVEEHFYLAWPWLLHAAAGRKRAQYFCVAIFVVSIAIRALELLPRFAAFNPNFTLGRLNALAIGCWLALAAAGHVSEWRRIERWLGAVTIASAALFLYAIIRGRTAALEGPLMFIAGHVLAAVLCGCLLVYALTAGSFVERLCEAAWLRYLGRISYGVYLIHMALFPIARRLAVHTTPHIGDSLYHAVLSGSAAVLSLLLASLSYRYFEKPFLRLKSRIRRPQYPQPVFTAVAD